VPLPASYRDFVQVFGPGEIAGYFIVFAPGYPNRRSGSLTHFIDVNRGKEIHEALIEVYDDEEFINRMLPFGSTIGGDLIVWDPDDVRDKRKQEYGVYILPDDQTKIVYLASSFQEFVEKVCLGDGFCVIAGPDWTADQEFSPFGYSEPPKRKEVAAADQSTGPETTEAAENRFKQLLTEIAADIMTTIRESDCARTWQDAIFDARFAPEADSHSTHLDVRLRDNTLERKLAASWHVSDLLEEVWRVRAKMVTKNWYGIRVTITPDGEYATDFNFDANCIDEDVLENE